jgi:DNA-binding IclR family transcriptional regulator
MDSVPEQDLSADEQAGGHRGVERIARILEVAAATPGGVRLIDAATMLDAPRSSIHSLLKGLTWVGYLEERDGRYVIGRGLQALLAPHQTSWLVELARDEVTKLSREVGETALLGVRTGDSIVYIFQAESNQSIHYTAKIGERRPIYPTSIGKLFLAAMDDRSLNAFFRAHPKLERTRVAKELAKIQREGIAYNREETVKGVTAAAAAIHGPDGSTLAAISVVGPVYRMTDSLQDISGKVSALAEKLTTVVQASPYARAK